MKTRLLVIGVLLLSCWGCGASNEAEETTATTGQAEAGKTSDSQSEVESETTSEGTASDSSQAPKADVELVELAEQLGMSVAELDKKKQMMMDAGLTAEEITKSLMMGGKLEDLFKAVVESNTKAPESLSDLEFVQDDLESKLKLKSLIGQSHLVIVFTRGYSGGMICPFCTTQVAQLAANYDNFVERDAKVLVVYPGATDHLNDFVAAVTQSELEQADVAAVRWPVLLDPDLKAVQLLNIAADLAQPSTFIVDKQGNVVFAYVGANRADRPSVQALLEQLDDLS